MSQPDSWFARNFTADDAATRKHVRETLIPRWHEEIAANERVLKNLHAAGFEESSTSMLAVRIDIAAARANITIAKKRLRRTTCSTP